jgi:hypothetical protein
VWVATGMTQQTGSYPAASANSPNDPPTREVVREQATDVGQTAAEAGQRVAGTAAEQAGQVGREARRQARDLLGQARGQVTEQARNGQNQASEGLRSLAGELHEMADSGQQQGPASDLAKQAADKLGDLAEWLNHREPGDLIEEVRALARRRPGAFLLGAAAAGILAGRLTRGAVDANRDTGKHAATDWDATRSQAGIGSAPPVVPSPAPVGRPLDYPGDPLSGYPAERPPAGPLSTPGSLPPEPGYQQTYPSPSQAGTYPAAGVDPGPVGSPVNPRPYAPGDADLTPDYRDAGSPTPPSGTRSVGEYVEELNSPTERRPEAGDPR